MPTPEIATYIYYINEQATFYDDWETTGLIVDGSANVNNLGGRVDAFSIGWT